MVVEATFTSPQEHIVRMGNDRLGKHEGVGRNQCRMIMKVHEMGSQAACDVSGGDNRMQSGKSLFVRDQSKAEGKKTRKNA